MRLVQNVAGPLPVAGILSQWESALGGIFVLHRVAQGSCNSAYEFNPYIFCRFIPHDLKERYSYHVTHGCYVTSVGDKLHQSSVSIPLCYSLPCCCLLTAVAAVTANSYNLAEKRLCQLCYLVSPFNHCQQLVRWLKRN